MKAPQKLVPLVHDQLRVAARRYMAGERPGHTLQTTALIHETHLRLVNVQQVKWQNRAHFFAMCAQLMRRILVDFARSHRYQKRGGGAQRVELDEAAEFMKASGDTVMGDWKLEKVWLLRELSGKEAHGA